MKKSFFILPIISFLFISGCQPIIHFFPVIGRDGTIYVTKDKNLYALNQDKTLKWKYTALSRLSWHLALGNDNTIYVAGREGDMYAINPDGTIKWRKLYESFSYYIPVIVKDTTIYTVSGKALCAMDLNGTTMWKFSAGDRIYSSTIFDSDGNIYVVSSDNNLYAINPDGIRKWRFSAKIYAFASPVIGNDNTVYVSTTNGNLYALNPDGKVKWKCEIKGSLRQLFIATDDTIHAITFDKFYALNPDGTEKWSSSFVKGFRFSPPAMDNYGNIYIGSDDGNLYAINADGTPKWKFSGSEWNEFFLER